MIKEKDYKDYKLSLDHFSFAFFLLKIDVISATVELLKLITFNEKNIKFYTPLRFIL